MTTTYPDAMAKVEAAPAQPMRRYLLAVLAGALLVLGAMGAGLALLSARGSLPPPQLSNNICLDEKLSFMRNTPAHDANLLIVGTSVAWRHFNSPVAVQTRPGLRPYNAGLCGTNMVQTGAVTRWLTERLPATRNVLFITTPTDFEKCTAPPRTTFDLAVADEFVFGDNGLLRYYLAQFDPVTLLRNARGLRELRTSPASFQTVMINRYGDGPEEPPHHRGLFYGAVELDPHCFAALRRTARDLAAKNVNLYITMTPLHPGWLRQYDAGGRTTGRIERGIRQATAGTNAKLLQPAVRFDEDAFYDAVHIRWSRTPRYTRALLEQLPVGRASDANGTATPALAARDLSRS